ncbi:hypothetical protein [Mesorhizobium sp. IMUNJ 23232]|uniref:hypothetical protein n=1 Tax=Mesorhizobium sp. IMUNJ 23232 TaxID=3376064 RepID=UPI0037BD0D2A
MPIMRFCLLAASVALTLFAMPARADTAAGVATAFCATRTALDEARLKPLLTPSLLAVIAEAEERNRIIAEATPDEKPPFGDGIPYQSFPDRPDTCEPGAPVERAGRTEVAIAYGFAKTPRANWTDTLILISAEGQALIDDIRFRESADGSGALTLREILHDAFDQ